MNGLCSFGKKAVRIEDELLCYAGIEGLVALSSFGQRDDGCVDDLCDGQSIVQDGLHELAVVFKHGRLASVEAVGFRPAEAEAYLEISELRGFVVRAGIFGDVEAGDANAACGAHDGHEGVEYGCGSFRAILALCPGFEAYCVNGGVDFGFTDDCGDEFAEIGAFGEVDGRAAYACGVLEAIGVHVADHDDGCAKDLCGGRGGEASRACSCDVNDGAHAHACGDGPMEAGGEDVGEHGEVFDLRHGLGLVREFDEVEVGVGNQDIVGLAADPSAHVDVAVGPAGAARLYVEADACLLLATGLTAAAGDVEGDGDEVPD